MAREKLKIANDFEFNKIEQRCVNVEKTTRLQLQTRLYL